MVDVTDKAVTNRRAEARVIVSGLCDIGELVLGNDPDDLLATAKAAALLGAKRTSSLIPLCHPLPITATEVTFRVNEDEIEISVVVETRSQTGVEMEALTACALGALSIVSQVQRSSPRVTIEGLALVSKSGGRSGEWRRSHQGGETPSR